MKASAWNVINVEIFLQIENSDTEVVNEIRDVAFVNEDSYWFESHKLWNGF